MDALAELGVSRETITDFCRRWKVKEFALFGSAARSEMRPDSDVDVMVEFEPDGLPHGWGYIDLILELEDLFVDPGWRRRGIAAALVTRVARALRVRGVQRLEVTANPHALGFYRAAGFIDCGVAETNFGAAPRLVLILS